MIRQGYALDAQDAAFKALRAGVDMEMVSTSYFDHLKVLLNEGKIHMSAIDEAVRNVLRLKFRLGLFDESVLHTSNAELAPAALDSRQAPGDREHRPVEERRERVAHLEIRLQGRGHRTARR